MKRIATPLGRLYEVEPGLYYPSVTTVIGYNTDKSYLDDWRNRTTNHEQISEDSRNIGTAFHKFNELYLTNQPIIADDSVAYKLFLLSKEFLDANVKEVVEVESSGYSKLLKMAGTRDFVYRDKNNRLILLDFKNCLRDRMLSSLTSYGCQIAAYAQQIKEQYGEYPLMGKLLMGNRITVKIETKSILCKAFSNEIMNYSTKWWNDNNEVIKEIVCQLQQ